MSGIEQELDLRLQEARTNTDPLPPVSIICGLTGSGKTPIIKQWLQDNKLDHIVINAPGLVAQEKETKDGDILQEILSSGNWMVVGDTSEMKNTKYNVLFSDEMIENMDKPGKVIFIDDYDWASLKVRNELLNLIRFSQVHKQDGDIYTLKNILLLIIVTHPDKTNFAEDYSEIEQQMFGKHI